MVGRELGNSRPSITGLWHVDVAEDDVEGTFLNFEQDLGAVAGFENFAEVHAGLAKGAFDDLAHDGGVVDD
jgi:hypothetical protein